MYLFQFRQLLFNNTKKGTANTYKGLFILFCIKMSIKLLHLLINFCCKTINCITFAVRFPLISKI